MTLAGFRVSATAAAAPEPVAGSIDGVRWQFGAGWKRPALREIRYIPLMGPDLNKRRAAKPAVYFWLSASPGAGRATT